MANVDFAPARSSVPSSVTRTFHAIAEWIASRRAEHARNAALEKLMSEPEHRLRDIGITREDLLQAMLIHRK